MIGWDSKGRLGSLEQCGEDGGVLQVKKGGGKSKKKGGDTHPKRRVHRTIFRTIKDTKMRR